MISAAYEPADSLRYVLVSRVPSNSWHLLPLVLLRKQVCYPKRSCSSSSSIRSWGLYLCQCIRRTFFFPLDSPSSDPPAFCFRVPPSRRAQSAACARAQSPPALRYCCDELSDCCSPHEFIIEVLMRGWLETDANSSTMLLQIADCPTCCFTLIRSCPKMDSWHKFPEHLSYLLLL